jgi:hypothetical protein
VTLQAGTIYEVFVVGQATASPPTITIKTVATSATARVRAIHASPDAPAVDIYLDGAKVLTNVPFFTASSYLDVPTGSHQLQITANGAPLSSSVISTTVSFETGRAYSVAATGLLSPTNTLTGTIIPENLSAPAAGKAKIRVYHFSPDTPAVGVRVAGGGPTLIPNLSFPNASDALEVASGPVSLEIFAVNGGTTLATLNVTLIPDTVYSFFVTGRAASLSVESSISGPNGTPLVYFPIVYHGP